MYHEPLTALRRKRVVVLPDLFIDALAVLPQWTQTGPALDAVAKRGGGNLPAGPVEVKLGGNAANLALALARLGARTELIAETNGLGLHLLNAAAKGVPLGVSHVRSGPRASATLSLECRDANIMLSDPGPLMEFGPERLQSKDWRAIDRADAVALVNWAQNPRGTELLAHLSARLAGSDTLLYVDTADPRHRPEDARLLIADPTTWRGVDVWSLNENEVRAFTGDPDSDPLAGVADLATRLDVRLDVHTRTYAMSVAGSASVRVDAETDEPRRLTGAGDAWNAGNLAGYLLDWPAAQRLRLAHRVASRYVTSADALPPRAGEVALQAPDPPLHVP